MAIGKQQKYCQELGKQLVNVKTLSQTQQSIDFKLVQEFQIQDKIDNLTAESKLLTQICRLSLENIPNILETLKDKRKIHNTALATDISEVQAAKQRELAQRKKEVLTEVDEEGQECISLCWVLNEKLLMVKNH